MKEVADKYRELENKMQGERDNIISLLQQEEELRADKNTLDLEVSRLHSKHSFSNGF